MQTRCSAKFKVIKTVNEHTKILALSNQKSLAQFENRIMPPVYVTRIMRSTMYEKLHFVSWNWREKN